MKSFKLKGLKLKGSKLKDPMLKRFQYLKLKNLICYRSNFPKIKFSILYI